MCIKKRILSLLLACVMLLGLMPTRVMAAQVSESLMLGEEKEVSITDTDDEVMYTYTADQAGRYIIYFRDLSDNPIGLGFQPEQMQYINQLQRQFQGHVIDLDAGESTFLTFMYPVDGYDENYHGYTATVGVGTPVAEDDFEGFAALGNMLPDDESDGPSARVDIQSGHRYFHFYTKQPLAYGVEWSVSCDNTDVLELDAANTSETPVSYSPAFNLKAEGEARITITAKYGSVTKSATYSVVVGQGGEGSGEEGSSANAAFFSDFDSLKALVESLDKTEKILVYNGTGNFIVTADLEIPGYYKLQLEGKDLVVAEGAALTVNGWIECGSLEVAGTLNAKDRINCRGNVEISGTVNADYAIGLDTELSVTGSLYAGEWNVNMQYPATVNGIENISFRDDWQRVQVEVPYDSVDTLYAKLLELLQIPSVPEKMTYFLYTPEYQDVTFVMDRDFTVPPYATLRMENWKNFLLEEDKLLINSNMVEVNVPFIVKGALENQGCLNINYMDRSSGQILFEDGSEYTGNGNIQVHSAEKNLDELLTGFNYEGFNIHSEVEGDTNVRHWYVHKGDNSGQGSKFETLDELIAEINKDDQSNRSIGATGTGVLEITQDLVIPEYLEVFFNDRDVIIEEGANVVFNSRTTCQNMTVKGHLTLGRWMNCNDSLVIESTGTVAAKEGFNAGFNMDVQGALIIERDSFDMNYPAQIHGLDNIQWGNDWASIYIAGRYNNVEELKAFLDAMSSNYLEHDRLIYCIDPQWHDENETRVIQITEDLTVPEHVELRFNGNYEFILEKDATITNKNEIVFNVPTVVKGSVLNEGAIFVNNTEDSNGVLTFGEQASYSGTGRIHVSYREYDGNVALELADLLQGLGFGDFDINEDSHDDGTLSWNIRYVGGLIKLGTPVDLQWGIEYNDIWRWDEETEEDYLDGYTTREVPGMMSWKTVRPDQARANIKIYEVGNPQPVIDGGWGFDPQVQPEYRSVDDFMLREFPTGSYYFTVQSEADYKEYRNSDVATSDVYHYVNPGTKLPTVDAETLHWEDHYGEGVFKWAAWLGDTSVDYVDGYYVEYYYSPTLDGEYEQFGGSWFRGNRDETRMSFEDHFVQDQGLGYYKFRIKVLSSNIEVICNSDWSEFSPVLDVAKIPEDVTDDLDALVGQAGNSNMTPDEIREEIQKIDPQDIKAALLTDQENNGATEKLAELEQKAGGQAPVTVTQDASVFNVNEVSVVGANLNNKSQADSDIKLIVDKPEEEHVIPERYNSSVAVKFSMTLENVEDPKNLAVPVKITLPIPISINPDFLVVIHYHADGSHELIRPYVYRDGNKFYADFVLTSFSDFIMTQDVLAEVYPDVSMFTFIPPTELTYDGTPKTASFQVVEGVEGLGEITVRYYDEEGNPLEELPVNAGTYLVALDVAEGDVFNEITELWDESWRFEIEKGNLPAIEIVDVPDIITYGDNFTLSVDGLTGTAHPVWEVISGAENAAIDQNGKVTVISAGDFSVKVTEEGDSNYNGVSCMINLSAQKKELIVSAQVEDKVYDGTTAATIKAINVSGLLEGDDVSINMESAEATFEDANVGTNKKVTVNGFAMTGRDADNYVLNVLTVEAAASIIVPNMENSDAVIGWIDAAKALIDAIEDEKAVPDSKDAVEQAVKAKQAYDALTESEKAYVGEAYAQQIAELYAKAVAFRIIEGVNGEYTKNSANGLNFRVNGAFALFKEMKADGVVISEEHYTAKAGSTVVELSTAYLNTLASGSHSLEVVYEVLGEAYSVEYNFTVKNAPVISDDESNNDTSEEDTREEDISDEILSEEGAVSGSEIPATGDHSNVLGWMYTMLTSAMALVVIMTSKKSKCRN